MPLSEQIIYVNKFSETANWKISVVSENHRKKRCKNSLFFSNGGKKKKKNQ